MLHIWSAIEAKHRLWKLLAMVPLFDLWRSFKLKPKHECVRCPMSHRLWQYLFPGLVSMLSDKNWPSSRHSRRMRNPRFNVSGKRPIGTGCWVKVFNFFLGGSVGLWTSTRYIYRDSIKTTTTENLLLLYITCCVFQKLENASVLRVCPAPAWMVSIAMTASVMLDMREHTVKLVRSWWRHDMKTLSALLSLCEVNSPVTCRFHSQGHWYRLIRWGPLMFPSMIGWTWVWGKHCAIPEGITHKIVLIRLITSPGCSPSNDITLLLKL